LAQKGAQKGAQGAQTSDVKVSDKAILKNVYFEVGKSVILPEAYSILEKVYALLVNNPNLRLELSGHTDSTGGQAINIKMSKDRAQSVANYFEAKGISAERLSAKGYSFDKPVGDNKSVYGRALNRRVEIIVVE
jgi:outer membrane protein OmpA-like peptidoglycan-associated protein